MDKKKLINWDAIALDGSNIRTLKTAARAKKHPGELADHELARSRADLGTKVHLASNCT